MASQDGVYINATPNKFAEHIQQAKKLISHKEKDHQILFLKSWNEWGEGNYVEPDLLYGHGFLEAISKNIDEST